MRKLYVLWATSLFIKLLISYFIPLSFDEAYYWVWSKNLQLSYYDHPPMVAWLFKIGSIFEGFGHAVRWPHVVVGHLTLLVWIYILKEFFALDKIRGWFWLALLSSLVGFGSLVATPDVAVMLFWSLSFLAFQKILLDYNKEKLAPLAQYFALGAYLGLGFLSKYHIVLFVFSALAYLIFEKKWSVVSLKGLTVTLLSGLFFSLPVLIWNYQNDFISFRFQIDHGLGQTTWDPIWSLSYPIGQALLLFPAVVWFALKAKVEDRLRYFYYFAWLPLGFFFLSSFRGNVEANWPIVAYPAVFALAIFSAMKTKWIWVTNAFWILLFTVFLSEYTFSWMNNPPRRFAEGHQYNHIVPKVSQYQPLYACTYQMASVLWYRSGIQTMKLFKMSRPDLFDHLQSGPPQEQKFYIVRDVEVGFPAWLTKKDFTLTKLEDIPTVYELYEVVRK